MPALIIEPTKLYQEIYSKIIVEGGLRVVIKSNAKEALEFLAHEKVSLICMSMQQLDMDGPELCTRIRKLPLCKSNPLIVFTSDQDTASLGKALIAGATEVYHKNELTNFAVYLDHLLGHGKLVRKNQGKILYIEDTLSVANVIRSMLAYAGHTVKHYTNAEEAFADFKSNEYDLVLTDILLEGTKTGHALLVDIKNLPGRHCEVPVLAISGLHDPARIIELLEAGASDYVKKPVLEGELLARVSNLIRMRKLLDKVEAQQSRLRELAMQDQLTKLYNRHFLMDVGPKKVSESCRHGIEMSLFVIDLDHFKKINDTYGHSTGDNVLAAVSQVLSDSSRAEDIVARFGGEEFVIVYTHCDKENALKKAEKLRLSIQALNPQNINITASIGVACIPEHVNCDFNVLFEAADAAVYKAKENGRNRVEFCDIKTST